MTDSPSEAEVGDAAADAPADAGLELAARLAELVGAVSHSSEGGVARVDVDRDNWVSAAAKIRDAGLPQFSFLTTIDWAREVEVGEPVADPDELEERFEVICRLCSVRNADAVHLCVTVPKDDASVPSLTGEFGGAQWHEREAAEMFGIEFPGNDAADRHLYLPDAFEGHPMLKSYPLLSREVKPWPGTVDVEDMPSTENAEAAAQEAGDG